VQKAHPACANAFMLHRSATRDGRAEIVFPANRDLQFASIRVIDEETV
jgi:hypothetical protein